MSKIEKLIKEKCPDGVSYKSISEVCNIIAGGDAPKGHMSDEKTDEYAIPIYSNGIGDNALYGYTDEAKIFEKCVTVSARGTIGWAALRTEPFYPIVRLICAVPKNSEEIVAEYLYFFMQTLSFQVPDGGIPQLTVPMIAKKEIPVPPIEVQQEIVRILDKFAELEFGLQAELAERRKQYEYYRETMLSFNNDIEIVTLDKCADIGTGSSNTIDGIDDGMYPFFVRSQKPLTMNKFEYDEIATITAGDGVGVGKVFHFIDGKYALHQRAYRIHITDKRINPKFFHYYFVARFPKFIFGNMYEGSVPSIRRPMLNKFEVPIPSMEEQNRIVDILDKFEEYCNNEEKGLPLEIEARHKQYEYYRDKLLTFERKVV